VSGVCLDLENVSKYHHFLDTLYEYGHDLDMYKIIEKVSIAISESKGENDGQGTIYTIWRQEKGK